MVFEVKKESIFESSLHLRIRLSQKLTSLKYKPHNVKEMPPIFKEKYQQKLMKNKCKPRSILKCVRYIDLENT